MVVQALVETLQLSHPVLLQKIPHDDIAAHFLQNDLRPGVCFDNSAALLNDKVPRRLAFPFEGEEHPPIRAGMLFDAVLHLDSRPEFHDVLNRSQQSGHDRKFGENVLRNGMGRFLHGLHV